MTQKTDFETFLFISKNKYQIFVYDKDNLKNLYNEEIKINDGIELDNLSNFLNENIYKIEKTINNFITNVILIIEDDKVLEVGLSIKKKNYEKYIYQKNLENIYNKEIKINDGIELDNLSNFLDENIYQIEKTINNFIKNIILIIEDDKALDVSLSIKKKNYERHIDQKHLENSLVEVKDIFRENHQDQIIMHMLIVNNDTNDDYSFLEVNFVSISNSFTNIFDKLLENHQIKIRRYMSGNYIRNYFGEDATELSMMANKLNNGLNKNEVQLVSKNVENSGFFEKFFQLFS